ncbi:FecR family protein [Microbacter margulisiae]|uniref:Ferric-dicitrate binding protein FerR (Iron transport regulator) n=1 Tax=Microbacter margulisiae TaxID=1350067 RepID=A0A7W5DNU9_9PORP|nr:FecR domain-containing protein [Microbacter margulisiae]MBB3186196.1 ferric-dicitrate binding protein FerR (iron transport regulator) [Microbacter margulisiae]
MTRINQLLDKFRSGNYSKNELNELLNMLQVSSEEDAIDVSMYLHWDECKNDPIGDEERFQQILDEIHHIINLRAPKPSFAKRLYTGLSRVAAILIIPLLIAFFIAMHKDEHLFAVAQNTVSVPLGAMSQFELPDGTHVWLNAGSKLTYPVTFDHQKCRVVALSGEGFFKVHKDKRFPFIVRMNGMDIRVTGTVFNARSYKDEPDVTVALIEGSVLLGKQVANHNVFEVSSALRPMEVAVLNKTTHRITLSMKDDLTKYIAWTQGRLVFDNDPIETVIEKLEKLYNIRVEIRDKQLLSYRFTATFTNESLDRALKIIKMSSPISFQIINGIPDSTGTYGQRTLILTKDTRLNENQHS